MRITHESNDRPKQSAKLLCRILRDLPEFARSEKPPKLMACQEAVAAMTGFHSWYEMEQARGKPGAGQVPLTDSAPSDALSAASLQTIAALESFLNEYYDDADFAHGLAGAIEPCLLPCSRKPPTQLERDSFTVSCTKGSRPGDMIGRQDLASLNQSILRFCPALTEDLAEVIAVQIKKDARQRVISADEAFRRMATLQACYPNALSPHLEWVYLCLDLRVEERIPFTLVPLSGIVREILKVPVVIESDARFERLAHTNRDLYLAVFLLASLGDTAYWSRVASRYFGEFTVRDERLLRVAHHRLAAS